MAKRPPRPPAPPLDLLEAMKPTGRDLARFCGVCRSWRSAGIEFCYRRERGPAKRQKPHLLNWLGNGGRSVYPDPEQHFRQRMATLRWHWRAVLHAKEELANALAFVHVPLCDELPWLSRDYEDRCGCWCETHCRGERPIPFGMTHAKFPFSLILKELETRVAERVAEFDALDIL